MGRNFTMAKRVSKPDDKDKAFVELCQVAQELIMSALEDGELHGYNGEWRTLGVAHHLDHADDHTLIALDLALGEALPADLKTEIAHGLCRLAMAEHRRRKP